MTYARDLSQASPDSAVSGLSAVHTATEGVQQGSEDHGGGKKRLLPTPRKIYVTDYGQAWDAHYIRSQAKEYELVWHEWLSLMTPAQRNQVKRFCRNRYEGLQPWTVWRMMTQRGME